MPLPWQRVQYDTHCSGGEIRHHRCQPASADILRTCRSMFRTALSYTTSTIY